MITTVVEFQVPPGISKQQMQAILQAQVPNFSNLPGLIRKYFLLSEDGRTSGGVYLWQTRQDADNFYSQGFSQLIQEKFGSEPAITYFESPAIAEQSVS